MRAVPVLHAGREKRYCRMNFSACVDKWGSDEFEGEVQTALTENEWQLPLDEFCQEGGAPDPEGWPEFSIGEATEENGEIVVSVTAHFKESISTSCKDVNFKERRQGALIVRIDKKTGSGEVEPDFSSPRFNAENY